MEKRPFGPLKREVPVIGQGTWLIENDGPERIIATLKAGLDLGMTHIDTAELYGDGRAESLVGRAIAGRRDEVFLVSKVLPDHASERGTVVACENSLERLKTDRLDCYLIHWPGRHPIADTIAGFERLKRDGKILSWGVSNFDVEELDEVVAIAGKGAMACNQVFYHLGERAVEHAVLPWCEAHNVAVVAYSPFGQFKTAFPSPTSKGGKLLRTIAEAHGATSRQVALAFLTRRKSTVTIPKAADPGHMKDNAAAGDLDLTEAEIAAIDQAFPRGRTRALPSI
jgi:diketogulonate reductase-like aldo/keto reductase